MEKERHAARMEDRMGTNASIRPGLKGKARALVRQEDLASSFGNPGVEVLSSMTLMTLLEKASLACVEVFLHPDQMCVGSRMEMDHLAPTPEGFTVTASAELVETKGSKLVFNVSAQDGRDQVAHGVHVRFLVDRAKFLDSVAAKKAAQGGEN
ncbi:thioesterase family protein [Dethiosulfatarculus sandiegensis]|uniref:thioesterase family protein n=1 Tax=Dethiosulfatarculus sandiegensis TaxID=1429043 RepID=UPI0012E104A6|nr:hotdog domain-containing protein [Dethiosulfatarculus sandiegensis]